MVGLVWQVWFGKLGFFEIKFFETDSDTLKKMSKVSIPASLETSCHTLIVVEVTLNRAEYGSRRSQQPKNVNFEAITRGPKSDIFD